ncbi:MAG: ABC transporter ATP-binding protein [Candidatus Dormibacteraceae bacterium]
MAIAELDRLAYWYPGRREPALRAAAFRLGPALTLVTGPSGEGKSTFLRLLNGLVPHFHGGRITGRAEVLGNDIITGSVRRLARHVGFVFQDPERQFVHAVVRREVAFGLENLGVPAAAMADRVDAALAAVDITALAPRRIDTLSGGERQRVAIAASLVLGSRLLVLDEPTSQLDGEGSRSVALALASLVATGHHVVVAEHRLETLSAVAHSHCRIEGGRPQTIEPAELAIERPGPRSGASRSGGMTAWSMTGVSAGPTGEAVVSDVSLEGREGEVLILRGPNGGGKTTILRTLAGLLRPLAGSVERRPGRIAYLPQDPAALLHLATVRAEVALTLARARDTEPPDVVLAALGLTASAGHYPRDLSAGQRQRVAIAATLAGRPAIALLDEPTRGMDGASRIALRNLILRLAGGGCAVVIATHDELLSAEVADRVVTIAGGTAA